MPLSHTGNIVKKIKLSKSKVTLIFTNDETLEFSRELADDKGFKVGDCFTKQELTKLLETDELNTALHHGLDIIKKGLISESHLIDKLTKKGVTIENAKKVIKILKSHDLINDEGLILDYLSYADELLYGQNKIKQKLFIQGIPSQRIEKIKFNQANELNKAKQVVTKLKQNYLNVSYVVKKKKIYSSLLSKGFTSEIALKALNSLPKDKDDKLLDNELKTAIKAYIEQNKHKYSSNKDIFMAMSRHFQLKGYPYNKIKQIWEETNEFID